MTDPLDPLSGVQALAAPPAPGVAPGPSESPAFRALLESLERLARGAAPAESVHDTESLKRAIATADDGFQQAMDLRRRLEDAFRQRVQ